MNVIVKRVVILVLIIISVFGLDFLSSDSLWLNTPTDIEVNSLIEDRQKQQEEINQMILEELDRDPVLDYENLFDESQRHTFIVEFTSNEFEGLINDMNEYNDMFGTLKSNNYRNVSVTYVSGEDIRVISDVGFRTKGNIYSRRLPVDESGNVREVHFMLKFNETFDLNLESAAYHELKTREFLGVEQLLFKWNNVGDPSRINEVFSYNMFTEIGVAVPDSSFAEVQIVIDGKVELVAFYKIFEHYDEEFVRRHFNEEGVHEVGDLYKGQWSATLDPIEDSSLFGVRDTENNIRPMYSLETNKDVYNYAVLIRFSQGINEEDIDIRKAFFEANFNIDSFLKAMAMNVLLGNPDDYRGNGNNFYYYFDRDGYMTYVPFDYDNTMGSGWDGLPAFINYTLDNDIYEWGHFEWNPFGIPLWDNLIVHEEYQIRYEDYLEDYIVSGLFSEQKYLTLFNTVNDLYGDDFPMFYDKEYFINTKRQNVLAEIDYYRDLRESSED